MADNTPGVGRSGFAGASAQQAAMSESNRQYNDAIRHLAINNPQLRKDPITLSALAKEYGHSVADVSSAIQVAHMHAITQRSLWGNLMHYYNNVDNWVTNVGKNLANPTQWGNFVNNFGLGLESGVVGLGKFVGGVGTDLFHTLTHPNELAYQVQQSTGGRNASVGRVIASPIMNAGHLVGSGWENVGNTFGYYGSLIKQKGYGYAFGEAMPSTLLAALTGGAAGRLIGTEIGDAAALDNAAWAARIHRQIDADTKLINDVKDWNEVSAADMVDYARANQRLNSLEPGQYVSEEAILTLERSPIAADRELGANLRERYGVLQMTEDDIKAYEKAFPGAEWAADNMRAINQQFEYDAINKVLGRRKVTLLGEKWADKSRFLGDAARTAIKAVSAMNKGLSSVPAQMFYLSTAAMASEANPELWERTRFGQIVLPNGKTSTVGAELAKALGFEDGFFHTVLAGFFNIDLNFVVDDPLTKALRVWGIRNSRYGYTGQLGQMFGGLGIRNPGDVTRAYNQYRKVRYTFDWIAKQDSPSEILKVFRGTFSAGLAKDLAAAKYPSQVINILESVNQGIEMVFSSVPVLSWYSFFKLNLTGALGDRFGYMGKILERYDEVNPDLVNSVKESTGVDLTPPNELFQQLNAAGKSKVLWRQRLRRQFIERPRWMNYSIGKETTRIVEVGDINVIPALMNALEVNGVSRLESRAFGDQLVEAAANHDYVAYRNAWKNVWKTVILRPIEALVPHAEYERLLKRFEEVLDFEIEKMLGVDGGGGIGRYVADHDPDWSLLVNEFGEMGHFGVGSMHQGKLILPEPARIKRMQKQLPIMLAGMTSSESEKALRFTENIREHLLQRAEFIEADVNDLVNNWRRTWTIHFEGEAGRIASEDPLIWAARRNVYRYYIKKYGELLTEKSKLGDTRVDRVANMIKELSAAKRGATQQLQEVQAGLERVTGLRHSLERGEALDPAILTAAEIESQIADMYRSVLSAQGELDAVKQLLAETQAMVQKSCFNMQDIEQMVAVNALLSVKELQQRKAWLDAFRKEYTKRSEGAVRPFNLFTLASRRGLRSNHELVHDFIQSYVNNRWFKPLALTSPAWAMRVSLSEVLVNSLRIGGFNYFESWAAAGIAKQRFRLGKEFDLPAEEQHRIKQVVAGILLGIDEGLIGSIDTVKKARLVQDAVDLMVLHDGHLPMGVHAHRDSVHDDVNEEAVVEALSGTEWNPQNWSKVKDYQLVAADSPYAGKAMHEYMTGIINDTIMGPVMHHMAEIVRQRGTEIFDANADVLYPRIQSAVFDYLQSNAAFLKRQSTLDKLRDDLMEMEDFRRANALERQRMLRELDDEFGNLDNIISASIPKAMEARLNRLYETYETLQVAQAKVSTELDEATAELDRLTSIVEGPGAELQANATRDRIKAEIDAASEQIRIKKAEYEARKQELEDHPYAPVGQKINSPAYLKYYRDLRTSLIEDLTKNIEEYQTSVTNRLNELFGEHKLVLPRGHYVEMAGNRFMTFVDEEGNVAPAVDLWQSIFEKYPQLWTNNSLRGYFPLGMSGVEGRDALAHIFGMEPAMFGRYPRTDIGKAEFIADYTAHAKVLRSRRASGLERQRSESWMRRYVSATNADWRLKPDAVWKRKEKAFAEGKELTHGLTPDQWFEEAIPLILHNDALTDALRSISWGHYGAAHSALRRVSEHDFNALTDSPRLFTDSEDFISQFSVRGIPASKILGTARADGLWKNENEVLAELALHMRQRIETEGTNLFNHNIHNSYTLNDYTKFAYDFEFAKDVLAEQSAHEIRAQKWLDSIPAAREREFDKATHEIASSLDQMYRAAIGGERELRLIAGQWREMSQEMGLLLKRLNGKYGDLRRLKFGSHFLGDVAGVEGVEATTVDDLLRSILGPEYVSRFVQEDGKIAAAPTLRPALNYADAHELYTAISKYFEKSVAFRTAIEATKALKKVSINGQSLADMTVEGRIAAIKKLINSVPGTEMHVPDTEKFLHGVVGAELPFPAGLVEHVGSAPASILEDLNDELIHWIAGRGSKTWKGYMDPKKLIADYESMDPVLKDFVGTINFSDYDGNLFTAKSYDETNSNAADLVAIIKGITETLKAPSVGKKVSAAKSTAATTTESTVSHTAEIDKKSGDLVFTNPAVRGGLEYSFSGEANLRILMAEHDNPGSMAKLDYAHPDAIFKQITPMIVGPKGVLKNAEDFDGLPSEIAKRLREIGATNLQAFARAETILRGGDPAKMAKELNIYNKGLDLKDQYPAPGGKRWTAKSAAAESQMIVDWERSAIGKTKEGRKIIEEFDALLRSAGLPPSKFSPSYNAGNLSQMHRLGFDRSEMVEQYRAYLNRDSAASAAPAETVATGEVDFKAAIKKVSDDYGPWVKTDFENARKTYGKIIGNPKISDEDFYNAMVKDDFAGKAREAESKFIEEFWLPFEHLLTPDLVPELTQLILYPEKYGIKNVHDFITILAHHFDQKDLMADFGKHKYDLDISARAITEDSAAPIATDTLETFMEQLANVKGPNSKVAKAALAEVQRAAVAMHLNKNFSNLGANALKDFEKANAARKKLADVVKPVYNPETRTKRQIGKFPSELNGAIGEANVDQLLAALGKHFTAKELDNMFGLGVARDSMDPTIKAANLQQALDNDARFVRAKVSAVDGKLNIDSLMVDLASEKSRNAINETVREIVRYGDMYNMPVQIELMFNPLNYSREGSMPYNSEQYYSLRTWLESFGFITKSDQPSKKDLPGTLIFEKKPTLARFTDRVEPAKFEFPEVSYSRSDWDDRAKLAKAQLTPRERADAVAEQTRELIAKYAPDPEKVANAKRFWDLFVAPSGIENPSAHKVWRRAIDMERSRLSVLNDREGYLKLQDQVFAARRELRAAEGDKRRAERSLGRAPSAEAIASGQERARERAEKKVASLSDREAALEDRIQRNGESIDTVRRTVITQHSRAVEREAARTRKFYEQRDKAGAIGRRPLIRRIVSRTNTMNDRIEELVGNYVNQQIIRLADDYYSSPEKLAELRSAVEDYAYAHLMTLPKETIDHYPSSRLPLANKELSTGDPMMDWARRIAVSMMGVTSAKTDSKFFAELLHRMDTNNMMGPRQSAAWLRNRIDKKESLPGPFPGKTPAGPLENGASIGLANKISEAAHSKVLGPIVNELVREPVFIWEYHSQMEMLRPLIERGFMTEDQAMVKAQIAASINMMKFVHNPQDKMVWEHNWRLFAPFYFAKNQALRRAFRMGGDNMAAFSKYMKINLAVTEFIAANVEQAAAAFQIPGSQVVASTTASMVGAYLAIFGYKPLSATQNNFGFDASPSSATSIIVTGVHPGAISLLEELIHIPMGPVFTVPAKFVYQHTALNRVWVHDFLTSLIGDVGMRSEIWEDLMPNSFARNAIKGGVGAKSQDGTGSYQSAETWVMSDIMDQMAYSYYEKALKKFPTLSSEQLDKYGSREALAQFYANQQMQDWLSNPSNAQHLLDEANTRTAAMWAFKTIGSVSTPFAVSIGDTFYDNKEFYKMANRRDANGELVYPTIQLASDAYLREHPDQMFAMLPHTKSPYNPYPQIVATSKFIRENEDMVRQYPQMASFFIPQGKRRGGKFDPEAQRMAMSIGLRERISPKEFVQMAQVYSGDKWFAAKELQYRMDPRNIDRTNEAGVKYLEALLGAATYEEKVKVASSSLGIGAQLTWNAYKDLDTEAKLYGRTHNAIWSEHHFGGARASLANDTYKELKQMLKNKDQFVRFAGQEAYDTYKMFSDSIESYHRAFLERKQYNYPTNDLKESWYAWCTEKALDPANENYAGFIYSVLRKVPDPTPDEF